MVCSASIESIIYDEAGIGQTLHQRSSPHSSLLLLTGTATLATAPKLLLFARSFASSDSAFLLLRLGERHIQRFVSKPNERYLSD
jgi:hypothetical protein